MMSLYLYLNRLRLLLVFLPISNHEIPSAILFSLCDNICHHNPCNFCNSCQRGEVNAGSILKLLTTNPSGCLLLGSYPCSMLICAFPSNYKLTLPPCNLQQENCGCSIQGSDCRQSSFIFNFLFALNFLFGVIKKICI